MGSLYSEHRSWLHSVPAAIKLLLFACLGTAQYWTDNINVLAIGATACSLLFISLGRAIVPARKLVASVVLASLLILAFHVYMQQATLGWISVLRLLSASLLGIALTLTTRTGDLLNVLERLLHTEWLQRDQRKVLAVEAAMQAISDAVWAEEEA